MQEAKYFKQNLNNALTCLLCPHYCKILPGESGKCRSRTNVKGKLFADNYSQTVTVSLDPIEKKPLYHFYPGSQILSVGSNSCNLSCDFCQNYSISQMKTATKTLTPAMLTELCLKNNFKYVAYTYTEPITWFEFVLDSAKLLKENSIRTVIVSNGFINPEPLAELLPNIDAMNIDLKSMNDNFYKSICGASVKPVLETIKTVSEHCHLEITNLLITGENDSVENIASLTDFIADVNPEIPLHLSKYYPTYKRNNPATPLTVLEKALDIASEKLKYVYLGNVLSSKTTYCPNCRAALISREYETEIMLTDDKCPKCELKIYGRFSNEK